MTKPHTDYDLYIEGYDPLPAPDAPPTPPRHPAHSIHGWINIMVSAVFFGSSVGQLILLALYDPFTWRAARTAGGMLFVGLLGFWMAWRQARAYHRYWNERGSQHENTPVE